METPSWFEPFKKLIQAIADAIFGKSTHEKGGILIDKMPLLGDKGEHVKVLQGQLNLFGEGLVVDGHFGPRTHRAVSSFQKSRGLTGSGVIGPKTLKLLNITLVEPEKKSSKIPWFWGLKKHEGKHESDSAFQSYMNKFWALTGLPSFKGLVGSARAWCGIFAAAGLTYAGYQFPVNSFRAKSWDNYCQAIDWKSNGFPQGAFVRINSSANCSSLKGNHITLANGDCAPQDLKASNVFSGFGGNQANKAKVSNYPVKNICSVRWPCEEILPPKITKSINCSSGKTADQESTR